MDQQPTEWIDITDDFKASAKDLELGELAKSEHFSLHEAMSAIVIMHPKMDSGMFHTGRKILNLEQSIKCGKLKVNNFTHQEMIGIIDETYACMVTWLEGYSLAQTVMTNLYLHEPNRIEDKCMRIFSCAVLKCTELLREIALSRIFFEEEEFLPGVSLGFHFADYVSDAKVLVSLKEVCDDLDKRIASIPLITDLDKNDKSGLKKLTGRNRSNINDMSSAMQRLDLESKTPSERELLEALAIRMKYTRFFYHALMLANKDLVNGQPHKSHSSVPVSSSSSSSKAINSQANSNKNISNTCDNISRNLSQALELIQPWIATIHFGVERPSSTKNHVDSSYNNNNLVPHGNSEFQDENQSISDTALETASFTINPDYPTIIGFEPLINQQLLPAAYPRCQIMSRDKSVTLLRDLSIRLIYCCKASKLTSFESILNFVQHFSKAFKPSSCIISRSFLQLFYDSTDMQVWVDLVRKELKDFADPVVLQPKSTIFASVPELRESVNRFIDDAAIMFMKIIRVYGFNRALQREKLIESIESLKTLQYQAVHLDYQTFVDKTCFGPMVTWVTYHIVRLCIEYTLLGFELELYSPHEYPYVFWYLYKFLYDRQTFLLNLTRGSIEEQEALAAKSNHSKKNSKSAKIRLHRPHQREITLSEALRCLSGGLYYTLSCLKLQAKIVDPKPEFGSEKIRFVHRFGPMYFPLTGKGITPDTRENYDLYQESFMRMKEQNPSDIYTLALNLFSQAKSLFELVQDPDEPVNECLRVVKTNLIVAKVLASTANVSTKVISILNFQF